MVRTRFVDHYIYLPITSIPTSPPFFENRPRSFWQPYDLLGRSHFGCIHWLHLLIYIIGFKNLSSALETKNLAKNRLTRECRHFELVFWNAVIFVSSRFSLFIQTYERFIWQKIDWKSAKGFSGFQFDNNWMMVFPFWDAPNTAKLSTNYEQNRLKDARTQPCKYNSLKTYVYIYVSNWTNPQNVF